jgi:hypothetical protein
MVLARMRDGRVVVDNAIALDDASMRELEAWGEPSVLIIPNRYHRQDARIYARQRAFANQLDLLAAMPGLAREHDAHEHR